MWQYLGVISCVLIYSFGQEIERPTVITKQGTIIGSVAKDGEYFAFHGIPFADSTSGSNRFKAPRPPASFQESFVADRENIKCIRALGNGFEGTEDCLVANIFTPTLNTNETLPVMVWIKGREFDQVNTPRLSFKNFVEREVVIVSLNFRESVFGFLCLGTDVAPGNAGLKDIISGLKWVKENIDQFGGDPNNINLVGHGSGAALVDLVTLSPLAEGLVNRAICQSGTAMAPWAVTRDNLRYAIEVAEALGHIVTDTDQLSSVFARTSVSALMAAINELDLTDNSLAFAPCVERDIEGVEAFLLKTPYEIISDGEILPIPFMTGYAEFEGTIRAKEATENEWLQRMDSSFVDFLQPDLKFESDEQKVQIAEEIKNFYFGDDTIDIMEYLSYHGDILIQISAIREARLRSLVSSTPIYLYEFSYKGQLGDPFQGPLDVDGASHGEELGYLFSDPSNVIIEKDGAVSDILIERWTNFVKIGIPISETSTTIWMPFSSSTPTILLISDRHESALEVLMTNPQSTEMTFWNNIYSEQFLDATSRWVISDEDGDNSEESVDENVPEGSGEEDIDEVIPEGSGENVGNSEEDIDEIIPEGSGENGDNSEEIDEIIPEASGESEGNSEEDVDEILPEGSGEGDIDENVPEGSGENGNNSAEDVDEIIPEGSGENGENSEEDVDEIIPEGSGENGGNSGEDVDENIPEGSGENGENSEEGVEETLPEGSGENGENSEEDVEEVIPEESGENGGGSEEDVDENIPEESGEDAGNSGEDETDITTPPVTDRGEEDDVTVTDSSEDETTTESIIIIESGESIDSGEDSEDGEIDEGEPDSASTAVGYTFMIVMLFGILNKLHGDILML